MSLSGGWFCGRVRYRISAPLSPGRSCHCSRCRKAFSGAGSAYAEVEPGSLSWVTGAENLTQYESTPGWGLCFCKTCGSTLCGMHEGAVHGVTQVPRLPLQVPAPRGAYLCSLRALQRYRSSSPQCGHLIAASWSPDSADAGLLPACGTTTAMTSPQDLFLHTQPR